MSRTEITELQRIFTSRLDTLSHLLDVGAQHLDLEQALQARLAPDMVARGYIADAKAMVSAIAADDRKLDETKRVGLGPGKYCELPARQYASDYLLPNLYFHMTTT